MVFIIFIIFDIADFLLCTMMIFQYWYSRVLAWQNSLTQPDPLSEMFFIANRVLWLSQLVCIKGKKYYTNKLAYGDSVSEIYFSNWFSIFAGPAKQNFAKRAPVCSTKIGCKIGNKFYLALAQSSYKQGCTTKLLFLRTESR